MIKLSNNAIEAAGFEKHPETDILNVKFSILRVYTLQGMVFEASCQDKISDLICLSEQCSIVIAQSVNEASQMLVDDVYADDEDTWIKDKKAYPPYIVICFRESITREMKGGYRKIDDGYIYTYDGFPQGKHVQSVI